MGSDYRVFLGCGTCGGGQQPSQPQPDPIVTGVEGESGAAQPKPTTT